MTNTRAFFRTLNAETLAFQVLAFTYVLCLEFQRLRQHVKSKTAMILNLGRRRSHPDLTASATKHSGNKES
jgi:hypothetical protein